MGAAGGRCLTPTAVIVTRGDVDLAPVLESLPGDWPVVVWDNSEREEDLKVYGHFAALSEVRTDYVYMQDDDAICPAQAILDAWNESEHADKILTNVGDSGNVTPWISWGAIFRCDLPSLAIAKYVYAYGMSDDVLLWCDMIFSTLTPWVHVDLGVQHLPHARAENRMCMRADHYAEQDRVKALAEALL